MFKTLRLVNFKSFRDATIPFGPFTVLVGTNASGKSNVRDALRFLHGIGRGYSLAEIIGGKWGDGGERVWTGIRGGTREIALRGSDEFTVEVSQTGRDDISASSYSIGVSLADAEREPRITAERLDAVFDSRGGRTKFTAREFIFGPDKVDSEDVRDAGMDPNRPILPQIGRRGPIQFSINVSGWEQYLRHISFLEPVPDVMREPSTPGANVLGERGENLSSVLASLCSDVRRKADLLEWLRQLTPLDVVDFQFPQDFAGRVLVHLVERDGGLVSANSASDGTLRFLGILAAILGGRSVVDDAPSKTLFIEELDAGIHPTRLHLLVQLIEQQTKSHAIQVVATTHAPSLLGLLEESSRADAVLVYRDPRDEGTGACLIRELPHAGEALRTRDLAWLHASGWLEDAIAFADDGVRRASGK